MNPNNIWQRAKHTCIQASDEIAGGFDIGFDKQIPEETQMALRNFISWAEENFSLPVTLWVDFEYRHYLIRRDGKRVGFLFYWADFDDYPVFNRKEDIPQIRLPVRTEHSTMEEILASFIEALCYYFAWLCNLLNSDYAPKESDIEEILQAYLKSISWQSLPEFKSQS